MQTIAVYSWSNNILKIWYWDADCNTKQNCTRECELKISTPYKNLMEIGGRIIGEWKYK
jgi:hypothetical protein